MPRGPSGGARWPSAVALGRGAGAVPCVVGREERFGDRLATLLGEARSDVDVEWRHLVEAGEPEAFEEFETGAVQEGSAWCLGATELDDESAVQQRPHRVVRVDATDALDRALRDG